MHKNYEKILFDLDNTLVNDDENRRYAINKILIERQWSSSTENIDSFIKLDNQFWKDRAEGKIKDPYKFKNKEEKIKWVRAQRFIKYFKDISFEEAVEINNNYMDYLQDNIIPIKNAQEILEYLYEKQYEIYIITNGPIKAINNKLSKINAQKYIKYAFSAEEAGHMKPHYEFFEKFFDKVDIHEKDEMIIIGDELDKDVYGGIKNGIDSCWFNRNKEDNNTDFKPTYEINSLIELKDIL